MSTGPLAAVPLLLVTLLRPAAAQAPPCTVPVIATRAALVQELGALPSSGAPEQRAAAIALLGQPVVRWALDIATDTTGATPAETRAAALLVLRYARWQPAIGELQRLAQPFRGPWIVWRGALSALSNYPYPELVPYWLDMMHFPRRVVREDALRGLALTADETVLPMVREATHHEEDADMLALVAEVERKLRLPLSRRDTPGQRGCGAPR